MTIAAVLSAPPELRAEVSARMNSAVTHTWLYFIQSGDQGPVKIGVARDPWQRLEALQAGNAEDLHLLAITWSSVEEERELHARFANDRIRGEWFRPSERLHAVVRQLQWLNASDVVVSFPERFPADVVDHHLRIEDALIAEMGDCE